MEGLKEFIQNRRNSVIVVGGLVAVAVIGCCLIGFYAITSEQPSQTQERDITAVVAEATATAVATEKPTNTAEPTDTPEPTSTPTNTPMPTDTATPAPTDTPRPTNTPMPTDTPAATATPAPPTATPVPASPAPTQPPPATDTPAPDRDYLGSGVWWCPGATTGAAYVGSIQSDKFHYLTCRWAGEIHAENRICFESRAAAVNFGYQPCGVCKP
jgi:outer membrane biosynthesis protein TonB